MAEKAQAKHCAGALQQATGGTHPDGAAVTAAGEVVGPLLEGGQHCPVTETVSGRNLSHSSCLTEGRNAPPAKNLTHVGHARFSPHQSHSAPRDARLLCKSGLR